MFEVSNAVADAMHHWREESGKPFLCVDCATHIAWGDAISAMDGETAKPLDEIPDGEVSDSRLRSDAMHHWREESGDWLCVDCHKIG